MRDRLGALGEKEFAVVANGDLAFMPAFFGFHRLPERQRVEEFVGDNDRRPLRHVGERGVPVDR